MFSSFIQTTNLINLFESLSEFLINSNVFPRYSSSLKILCTFAVAFHISIMKKNNHQKTNAARILDRLGISYELVEYEVDEDHLGADHLAATLGQPVEQVFKTLVLRGDRNGLFVCVIAGNEEVDLKKAARVSGNKKAEMLPLKELLPSTGYIRGGCTSIGMKKHYPTFFSQDMKNFDKVYVSAGQRGLQLKVNPMDLAQAAEASFCDLNL